ncbi:MAG: deoxyuridine 5'-triphosphate nucleotidohydrolase [Thermoprotei archaeon]|nr:deoxyuridine 5'-triphosphate nucleotidohydrolase [Thermoprotei archaeon]
MIAPGWKARVNIRGAGEDSVQPAGVDLSVCELSSLESEGVLGASVRELPRTNPLEPLNGWWHLKPGAYRVRYCEIVEIPLNYVALCFPRSSILRMGAEVKCTVWDPGYKGRGEGLLVVYNPNGVKLERGARVVQLIFAKLEDMPGKPYSGMYMNEGLEKQ